MHELTPLDFVRSPSQLPQRDYRLCSVAATGFWTWLICFATASSLCSPPETFLLAHSPQGAFLPNSYLRFVGTCLGCLTLLFLKRATDEVQLEKLFTKRNALLVCTSCIIIQAIYYVALVVPILNGLAPLLVVASFAVGIIPSIWFLLLLLEAGRRRYVATLLIALVANLLFCDFVFKVCITELPILVIACVHAMPLLASILALSRAQPGALERGGEPGPTIERAPQPLLRHLFCFSTGMAAIQTLIETYSNLNGLSQDLVFVGGGLLAAAFVELTCKNLTDSEQLWYCVRGIVFPILGVCLIALPLFAHSAVLFSFTSCLSNYYNFLILVGCFLVARDTRVAFPSIFLYFYLVTNLGCLFGIALATLGVFWNVGDDPAVAFWITLVIFALLSFGIFHIGHDSDMRKWWGLRRSTTEAQRTAAVLEARISKLVRAHGLSRRESEVLLLVAKGERPEQVADDLFISVHTARHHIQSIYNKTGAHSSDDLLALIEATPVRIEPLK